MHIELKLNDNNRLNLPKGIYLTNGQNILDEKTLIETPIKLFNPINSPFSKRFGAFTYSWSHFGLNVKEVGRYCSIAAGVQFGPSDHPSSWLTTSNCTWSPGFWNHGFDHKLCEWNPAPDPRHFAPNEAFVTIGNDVWIGHGAVIKQGIKIADGAIIGAMSVVTKDIPAYAVVAGVPAKIIKYRFTESLISELLELNWWNYSASVLNGIDFTSTPLEFMELLKLNIYNHIENQTIPYDSYNFSDVVQLCNQG